MNQPHQPSGLSESPRPQAPADEPSIRQPFAPQEPVIGLLCPGGYEHAGGIGRVMRQLTYVWDSMPVGPNVIMIDTRGHGGPIVALVAFLSALLKVAHLKLAGRLALLHINLASRGSTARKVIFSGLAAVLGVPTVVHLHGALFDIFYRSLPRPMKAIVRRIFNSAARVVVLGEVWRRFLVRELGISEDKIEIVYNGTADPNVLSLSSANRTPKILFLGRLGQRKGLPELLAALASSELRARSWHATLAGDGDLARYKADADRLGLADRIEFPGWVDHSVSQAMLRSADILVLPSHQEGQPMSVIEALAHRVAVVTTPVGATPELVEDEVSGLLVAPGDSQALAAALIRLIEDRALRRRLGENGYRVFREKLDINVSARRFCDIYADVRAGHARANRDVD